MPEPPHLKIGVLASGRGSNFEAIARAVASGAIPGELAVLVSDRAEAPALSLARAHGIESLANTLAADGLRVPMLLLQANGGTITLDEARYRRTR